MPGLKLNHVSKRGPWKQSSVSKLALYLPRVKIWPCSFLDATEQLYECFSPSVRLSHLFGQCSSYRIIIKLLGVITVDKGDVHANGQGQRPKVKVTEVKTQSSHFRTVTPVRIQIWRWNDVQSLMWLRRCALLFSRSFVKFQGHGGQKNCQFWPELGACGL